MTTTLTPATASLIEYLRSIGGTDVHVCCDAKGEPDPLAARQVAESLRERHGAEIGLCVNVVQHANRVIVTLIDESPIRPLRA